MSATLARATAIFCSRKKSAKITEYRDTAPLRKRKETVGKTRPINAHETRRGKGVGVVGKADKKSGSKGKETIKLLRPHE